MFNRKPKQQPQQGYANQPAQGMIANAQAQAQQQAQIPQAQMQQPGQAPNPQMQQPAAQAKQSKAKKNSSNSTQNILNIAEIRDGMVIMNDGSFRSVVYVKSINFDLMSPQERENTEYAFQGFINSLYFPIQIFIRSQKVDMSKYLETLDKKRSEHENLLISIMMDDYIEYIDAITQSVNIMDKKFYIIVPYYPGVGLAGAAKGAKGVFGGIKGIFTGNGKTGKITVNQQDLEKAQTELKNRTQATLGGLANTGVRGIALSTEELIELYYDVYNPDTATRQQISTGNINNVIITGGGPRPESGVN